MMSKRIVRFRELILCVASAVVVIPAQAQRAPEFKTEVLPLLVRSCGNCHSERECVDCHDGRVRPRSIHPNDFLSLHAVEAQKNGASCTSCHRQQSFCLSCHQRSGVAQSGPFENFLGRGRFHPPKSVWTDGPRSSRHHAWEAQRTGAAARRRWRTTGTASCTCSPCPSTISSTGSRRRARSRSGATR